MARQKQVSPLMTDAERLLKKLVHEAGLPRITHPNDDSKVIYEPIPFAERMKLVTVVLNFESVKAKLPLGVGGKHDPDDEPSGFEKDILHGLHGNPARGDTRKSKAARRRGAQSSDGDSDTVIDPFGPGGTGFDPLADPGTDPYAGLNPQ